MATILIAEDRDVDRRYLATLLSYYGHRVIQTHDGAEALAETTRQKPDLVISDVLMPTMDGFEFVRRLRLVNDLRGTPVIFYTATYHEREARMLATQCNVADVLTKPTDPEAIIARVDAVLGRPSAVVSPPPDAFQPEHLRVVTDKLVEKERDLEASEQRLAAVIDLCHRFASQRDPLVILRDVCSAARDVTLAQHAVLGIVNEDRTSIVHFLTHGIDASQIGPLGPATLSGPLLTPILRDRTPVRQTNASGRPENLGLPATHPSVHSYLGVPIMSATRVYGWIGLRNKLGASEFDPADEQIAGMIGAHAGIAYENARLIEDLRTQGAELRASEERTKFALGAGRMGVWEFDLAADGLLWSETMAPVFGLTPDRVPRTGEEFFRLIHATDRQQVEEAVQKAVHDGTELSVEFRTSGEGPIRWVGAQARVLHDHHGNPTRILGVGIDVTERRSLEAQLRQAQKLEAVGQLAGGVAHDFNNLLTAILGYSGFVLDTLDADDPRRAEMQEVIKAGERAAALTGQLLAFSRKQVLQPTTVDLNALVAGMRHMLSRLIGEHVEIVSTLAPDLGLVRADPGQLEQVLMNLAVNARDAMPVGGRLSVETANVDLDDSYAMHHTPVRPGPYVMLAVSDSGLGMDEDTKRHLFEPFFTTKERGKGTGLGLATIYGIVKQSGGYIWVYSEPGRGATFKVYLPRTDQRDEAKESVGSGEPPAAGTEAVLVVEDEEAVRFLTRVILEKAGYRVLDAPNPEEAERLFERNASLFDLLVTDVIMPGSSGPKLFERLARLRPDLKVLYVSGYTGDTIVHQGQLDPGIAFLQKPFTADALSRRVREVLDRRS